MIDDAIVIGEHERAFYDSQYASMAPLFAHYWSRSGRRRRAQVGFIQDIVLVLTVAVATPAWR